MSVAPRYWILLLCLAAVWGSSYALIEVALVGLDPLAIAFSRLVCGLLTLVSICLALRLPWPRDLATHLRLVGIGVFGNVLPFFLISWGQLHIDSAVAGILMAIMPLSVLVFTHLLLPEDPLTRWHWLGVALGMSGLAVVMQPNLGWPVEGPLSGHLAVLGAACSYGLATVFARQIRRCNVWTQSAVNLGYGTLLIVPLLAWTGTGFSGLGWNPQTGSVVVLGVFSTGLASVLFFSVVRNTSASFVANINFLIPIWAVLLGALVMDEQLPSNLATGLALVLLGVGVAQRRPAPAPAAPATSAERLIGADQT